mmetsp:Transcript_33190/g.72398  ORF Transcript_33190/g.72398 Transcript_33190/m.72398 type:complete len:403 (+) Transcript_33190:52-1260(+)
MVPGEVAPNSWLCRYDVVGQRPLGHFHRLLHVVRFEEGALLSREAKGRGDLEGDVQPARANLLRHEDPHVPQAHHGQGVRDSRADRQGHVPADDVRRAGGGDAGGAARGGVLLHGAHHQPRLRQPRAPVQAPRRRGPRASQGVVPRGQDDRHREAEAAGGVQLPQREAHVLHGQRGLHRRGREPLQYPRDGQHGLVHLRHCALPRRQRAQRAPRRLGREAAPHGGHPARGRADDRVLHPPERRVGPRDPRGEPAPLDQHHAAESDDRAAPGDGGEPRAAHDRPDRVCERQGGAGQGDEAEREQEGAGGPDGEALRRHAHAPQDVRRPPQRRQARDAPRHRGLPADTVHDGAEAADVGQPHSGGRHAPALGGHGGQLGAGVRGGVVQGGVRGAQGVRAQPRHA